MVGTSILLQETTQDCEAYVMPMMLRDLITYPMPVELVRADTSTQLQNGHNVIVQHLKLRCRICWAETYVMLPIEFDELAKKTLPHVHNDDWREYVEESEQQ
jgi:hypothetical protein